MRSTDIVGVHKPAASTAAGGDKPRPYGRRREEGRRDRFPTAPRALHAEWYYEDLRLAGRGRSVLTGWTCWATRSLLLTTPSFSYRKPNSSSSRCPMSARAAASMSQMRCLNGPHTFLRLLLTHCSSVSLAPRLSPRFWRQ